VALADALRAVLAGITLWLRQEVGHLHVSPSQATVLVMLLDGPRRMTELTRSIGVAGPSMTVLVDRMERAGWVRRASDPADRRAVRVEITLEGREAILEVQEARAALLAKRLATLSPEYRAAIADAIPALAALAAPTNS